MSAATAHPKEDLAALTGLRGVAAWYVVLYHIRLSAAAQLPPSLMDVLAKGYLAVDLFFMLSGFVLWLNYSDRLRAGGLAATPAFIARRIARIWPLHLFVLAGAILFAAGLAAAGKLNPDRFPFAELPLHILLVQNWGFTGALSWNVPAWSISCEFFAYLLFPLLTLAIDWRKVPAAGAVAAIFLLALFLSWIFAAAGTASLGHDVWRFGLVRAVCEFVMGTAVCGLWLRWRGRPGRYAAATILLTLPIAAAALLGLLPEPLAAPLAFAGLLLTVALLARSRRNPLASAPIRYLGEISYATYLSHFLLFVLFKLLFVADQKAVPLPLLAAFLMFVLLVSIALHHLVEKPAQKAMNRLLSRRRRAPPELAVA